MKYLLTRLQYKVKYTSQSILITFTNFFENESICCKRIYEGLKCVLEIETKECIELEVLQYEYEFTFQGDESIMCNGFQSWTETRLFSLTEKMKPYHPLVSKYSKPFGDATYCIYSQKKGFLHAWSYAYIQQTNQEILLIASRNDEDAFTHIAFEVPNNRIVLSKDIEGCIIENRAQLFSLYIEQGNEDSVFKNYFDSCGFTYHSNKMNGWTSWYHYFTNIDESIIQKNISNYIQNKNYSIDVFQIDDGWQADIGSWTQCNKKFANGLQHITQLLHQHYIKAGLWLAPFIVEKKSELVKKHPEYILKDEKGKWVKAGYNPMWSGSFYVLDFYHEGVRNYLKQVFETITNHWGFDMLKLDFLYAVCLRSRPGKTRGHIMYDAMKWIRSVCPNTLLLACGVPLMPCAGHVDFCRIGPDVSMGWNERLVEWFRLREGISTRRSVNNTISRRHLDGYWFGNDPDVFILRNEKQKMSKTERAQLFEANKKYGSVLFTSDDISYYDNDMHMQYASLFNESTKQ